ncbi:GDSL-type esterase/lipase family protein [Actinoplanes sp. NPDC023714]|uniref:GDSL-type esterase/lipase family protein n=1 Tax=Actinoplanes sp. NPDC023714 TaxID=3154322 RepID=UPI0033CD38A1
MRRFGAAVAACALVLTSAPAPAQAQAAGEDVTIGYPAEGQTVGTGPLTVTGSVLKGGIREVTVERDGRPPFPATVDSAGGYAAPVGTIGTGVHRIVVRVVFTDGHTAESRRWFTGRAGTRYVALGDSYAAGDGVEPYRDLPCHRSTRAWPMKITLPGGRGPVAEDGGAFAFEACAGARLADAGAQTGRLGTDADLVTLTFGGSDAAFAEVLAHCATRVHCMRGTFITAGGRSVSLDDWMRIRIALVRDELDGLFQRIRSRVRPDTTVVAATYPRPLRTGSRACREGTGIAGDERKWMAGRVDDFADAVLERASRSGVLVADVREEFAGHAVCDRDAWIGGLRTARATDLSGDVTASFHPDERGATAYAKVVSRRIAAKSRAYRKGAEDGPPPSGTVVKAVAATRIVPLVVADAAAMRGMPSCGAEVVRDEQVPFAAEGFTARSEVTIRLTGESTRDRILTTVTANDQGRVTGWARMPADLPAGKISGLEARGHHPSHGTTLGFAVLRGSNRSKCVDHARKAGLLSPKPPPLPSPGSAPALSRRAGNAPELGRSAGRLPRTGDPGWLLPAALTGIAMIVLGALLVTATARRRVP